MRTPLLALVFILGISVTPQVIFAQVGGVAAVCPVCGIPDHPPCPPCKALKGVGICVPPGGPQNCRSLGVNQGDGSFDGASSQGAQQMMKMAQDLIQKLMQGQGGGGGGGGGAFLGGATSSIPSGTAGDIFNSIFDTVLDDNASSTEADRVTDILGSLQNTFGDTASSSEVVDIVTQIVQLNAQVNASNTASTTVSYNQPVYGDPQQNSGILPSIQVLGNSIVTNVVRGLTGIGSFIAGGAASNTSGFFENICSTRPWQSGVFATLFSTNFFDNLCVNRGYGTANTASRAATTPQSRAQLVCPKVVDVGATASVAWSCGEERSSGVGFSTNGAPTGNTNVVFEESTRLELQCANGARTQCDVLVDAPTVSIEVSPTNVSLGSRARLFWTSRGATSCVVRGLGMNQEGVTGAAATPAIYDRSEFTITCTTASGSTIRDSVVVDIGL